MDYSMVQDSVLVQFGQKRSDRRLVPLGRMGTSDDSANALSFLCSEQAAFINGQSLLIDGGVSVIWPEEVARSFADLKGQGSR